MPVSTDILLPAVSFSGFKWTTEEDMSGVGSPPPSHGASPATREWLTKMIQKTIQAMQTDENKKMIQVFLVDPLLNHVLDRIFPYVLILCVLFVLLTLMMGLTFVILFTRFPAALRTATSSAVT